MIMKEREFDAGAAAAAAEEKKKLRKEMKALRAGIPAEEREAWDRAACEKTVLLARSFRKEPVLMYMSFSGEVCLDDAIRTLLSEGIRVGVPRCYGQVMKFHEIRSFDDLESGTWGIREPKTDCPVIIPFGSLVLVPGLAFGPDGERLGYGGGYYDRYFSEHLDNALIGVCYELQADRRIPCLEHDLRMFSVLTEKRFPAL